jgi:aromatic ring-cleaving dioxygenase
MTGIRSFDAHIYYDELSFELAKDLIDAASKKFILRVGHMHRKPVGPHPSWSCVLEFKPPLFSELVPWLMLNRNGLAVLVHPDTGDDLVDHGDYALWMGEIKALDFSVF